MGELRLMVRRNSRSREHKAAACAG